MPEAKQERHLMIAWPASEASRDRISGDRRNDRRYSIALDLRWKLVHRRKTRDTGEGRTIDLSSGGIRFESDKPLPKGMHLELSISWPVLLHNVAPMQLVVCGRVVRSRAGETAIAMTQHEFRTAGTASSHHQGTPPKVMFRAVSGSRERLH